MAIEGLPGELPIDASKMFENSLENFIPTLVNSDFSSPDSFPEHLRTGLVILDGNITPQY